MELVLKNKDDVDAFMNKHINMNHTLRSEKGPPPAGATLDGARPITWDINMAWVCDDCGERIEMVYTKEAT